MGLLMRAGMLPCDGRANTARPLQGLRWIGGRRLSSVLLHFEKQGNATDLQQALDTLPGPSAFDAGNGAAQG